MRKIILVVHISLDGYVAGSDGELTGFDAAEQNLRFVADITDNAGAAMFGRKSFELLDAYWPFAEKLPDATEGMIRYSKWYNSAEKIVLSTTYAGAAKPGITIINGDIEPKIRRLKAMSGKNILLFGSPASYQSIEDLNLVDEYWIFVNPVLFGRGIPLFREQSSQAKLRLIDHKIFANGEVALNYVRERTEQE